MWHRFVNLQCILLAKADNHCGHFADWNVYTRQFVTDSNEPMRIYDYITRAHNHKHTANPLAKNSSANICKSLDTNTHLALVVVQIGLETHSSK